MSIHQKINELKGQSERLSYPFSHGESSHSITQEYAARDLENGSRYQC